MHWSEKTAIKENVYQQYIRPHKFNIHILYGTLTDTNTWMHTHTHTERDRETHRGVIYTQKPMKKLANTMNRRLKKKYNKIAAYPYSFKNKITSQIVSLPHS